MCVPITSGIVGIPSEICHVTWREASVNVGTNFGRVAPNKTRGQKRPNFGANFDNFRLCSRISPDWIYKAKSGKALGQLQLPYRAKKNT